MKYYTINEQIARIANDINSFSTYTEGKATSEYKYHVDKIYSIVEAIRQQKPTLLERAEYMADRYAKKLADYYNAYYRNEASCPSVMISGPANFPVRKKERQNSRRDTLMHEWEYLQKYADRIKGLLYNDQPIKSNDANALELLSEKVEALEETKELMKQLNAFYKKHGNLEDFPGIIPEKLQQHIDFMIRQGWAKMGLFDTSNTNAEIRRLKDRIAKIQAIKGAGTTHIEYDSFRVVENTELMRLQLIFEGKPDEETRNTLKKNGFKWAPSQGAWQRQLNENSKYALKRVIEELTA